MEKVYRTLAGLIEARANCARSGNREWHERHGERLRRIVADYLPSGSGVDSGTTLEVDVSTPERLVFVTAFHHMNGNGFYDGWTQHEVIVTPSLHHEIKLRITGHDRNEIKDYLHEVFHAALTAELDVAAEYAKQEARAHG
jgi:hypothetical protein